MVSIKIPYTGQAASPDAQISQLIQHGVSISNVEEAKHKLSYTGYYRLLAYAKPLLRCGNFESIPFSTIWSLYVFDRKLRAHLMDALERVEIAFRVSLSEVMSMRYGP